MTLKPCGSLRLQLSSAQPSSLRPRGRRRQTPSATATESARDHVALGRETRSSKRKCFGQGTTEQQLGRLGRTLGRLDASAIARLAKGRRATNGAEDRT